MQKIASLFQHPEMRKVGEWAVVLLILTWCAVLVARPINLATADLGRHIKNGEMIVKNSSADFWQITRTNFYSFTLTDQPFINHHWGSGVVFYLIHQAWGFNGVSIFYVFLGAITLLLFFDVARKASNLYIAVLVSALLIPLMAARAEVRPEMFTYFFSGIFLWLLWNYRANLITGRWLFLLPILTLLWVNLHIGFVFGFLILGVFSFEQLVRFCLRKNNGFLPLLFVLALCLLAGALNPNFVSGLIYPINIFKNYGYLIVENQSIRFLEKLNFTSGQHFLLFKIIAGVAAASFILVAIKSWRKLDLAFLILTVLSGIMAYLSIRNFPSFGFFVLPTLAANIYLLKPKNFHKAYVYSTWLVGFALLVFAFGQQYASFAANKALFGIGLLPTVNASADFFKSQHLQGPIFNNYDIGGYLIYYLYPKEKVFVDNRPEAYSEDFFQQVYIPSQQDPQKWMELDAKYKFNSIFFSHRDYTPWGQAFLIARVEDPLWAPVFVDSYNIIFLKRNELNKVVIKQYEIPKNRFGIIKN